MLKEAEVTRKLTKSQFKRYEPKLRVDLLNHQFELRSADFSVILLIFGDDRIGGNEVVNLLNEWLDARRLETHVLEGRTDEDRRYPALWRYWQAMPPKGSMSIFFGAWMHEAVSRRYRGEFSERDFDLALDVINRFEREIALDGTLLLKFYFHLPEEVHEERWKRARKDPWHRVDKEERKILHDRKKILPMLDHLVRRTNTPEAPWIVVNSEDDEYRNLVVARAIRDSLAIHLKARAQKQQKSQTQEKEPSPRGRAQTWRGHGLLRSVDLKRTLTPSQYRDKLETLQSKLFDLSRKNFEKRRRAVLVFEGWDAAGKGGAIRRLTAAMDVRCYRVTPIAAPTEEEKSRHYLWRFWRRIPPPGVMTIYDRSWYGRVLVERVEGFATEEEWRRSYGEINDFEQQLTEGGILVLKFWLHIDPETQMRRFRERKKTAYKEYKITSEDMRNRDKWNRYVPAVEEMFAQTSTDVSPWNVIPANDKKWARIHVLETVVRALEKAK